MAASMRRKAKKQPSNGAPHPLEFFGHLVWLDGRPLLDRIEPYPSADAHEIIDVLQPARALPVGLEQRPMHLVVLALPAREFSGAQRLARVDDHVALPHHKPNLGRDLVEAAPHLL